MGSVIENAPANEEKAKVKSRKSKVNTGKRKAVSGKKAPGFSTGQWFSLRPKNAGGSFSFYFCLFAFAFLLLP